MPAEFSVKPAGRAEDAGASYHVIVPVPVAVIW
jgi:hypothetical protein